MSYGEHFIDNHKSGVEYNLPFLKKAWKEFYEWPLSFRGYCNGRYLMAEFMKRIGIDVPRGVIDAGPEGMQEYWVKANEILKIKTVDFEPGDTPEEKAIHRNNIALIQKEDDKRFVIQVLKILKGLEKKLRELIK